MIDGERESVLIDRLSGEQRIQLQTYLRGADIPFELSPTTVSVDTSHIDDLFSVLEIVGNAKNQPAIETTTEVSYDHETGGSSGRGETVIEALTSKMPIVVERPVIVQGQTVASPTRRFVGAMIDWLLLTTAVVIADKEGLPNVVIVAWFSAYIVIGTALWGRTIGKLVVGSKVIGAASGRAPGFPRSIIRWIVVSWGTVLEVVYGTWPIGVATVIFAILVVTYSPILWDVRCRGWHDRAADTVVVRTGSPTPR